MKKFYEIKTRTGVIAILADGDADNYQELVFKARRENIYLWNYTEAASRLGNMIADGVQFDIIDTAGKPAGGYNPIGRTDGWYNQTPVENIRIASACIDRQAQIIKELRKAKKNNVPV